MFDAAHIALAVVTMLAVGMSFFVSASAGLGGSLILVPTLALVLGAKEGVALAALLLGANNLVKLFAYRATIPFAGALKLLVATVIGTYFGARLLVAAPTIVVTIGVIFSFGVALIADRRRLEFRSGRLAPALALGAGATSGFTGTSGPMKGVAIRSLDLDRRHTVGAAALISTFGDLTKAAVFTESGLLGRDSLALAAAAVPLMLTATFLGRRFNSAIGELGYERLFWLVMGGYTARLLLSI